ncbi:ataxin-1-like isoform X2 [Varroa destructor]|nr:ataxin-1-like isoform X2 [Varroa destructor]XP_022652273.1 ataxin-1-like isoform X2 [Varroa destructor]XP_022652274.1 ataxin-1-like isoform X2 [Varroa destructor]XP_022652275.1 ataxin-1-like isoform X2 [Varroa destructor]XP_022652276.1 ataxin-1-like isoform X2 [Varroa destructor]XP_022652277.1 ataxin-1-like isoform X2 [Varroa destructor]XP_022652278.1 ataxin-1-like isoform X2 [Varroa destructor]
MASVSTIGPAAGPSLVGGTSMEDCSPPRASLGGERRGGGSPLALVSPPSPASGVSQGSVSAAAAAAAAHPKVTHQQQQHHEAFAAMNASQAALFGSCQLAAQGGLLGGLGGIGGLGSPATFFPAGLDLAAHLQLQRQYNSSLSSLQQHLQQQQQSSGPSSQPASLPPSGGGSQQPQQMAAAAAAAAAAASPFNPTQSPLLSPFFASRFFAQPSSPSPPSASPLKIKKEDGAGGGGAFQPIVLQHDDTPSPKFARIDYLSAASTSSGLPATPSTLSSPGSDSFASYRGHHKLSQASSGPDSVSGSNLLLKGESPTQLPPPGLAHFKRGSIIRLADGKLRTVEQVSTEDLVQSAEATPGVQLDSSRVLRLEPAHQSHAILITFAVASSKQEVSVESPVDRPFFVFNRGWSSCDPPKTLHKLGLQCHKLQPGDICVTLSKNVSASVVSSGAHASGVGAGSLSEEDSLNDLRRYPSAVKGNRRWSAPDPPTALGGNNSTTPGAVSAVPDNSN